MTTRSPYESLAQLRLYVAELDAHAMKAAIYAQLRGGLPAGGSDGRGASEPPLPGLDPTDRDLVKVLDEYEQRLDELCDLALKLVKKQRAKLWVRPTPISKAVVLDRLAMEPEPEAEKVNWCVSCIRVKVGGYQHHSPVADEKRGGKDCTLCRWCLDLYRETGSWPSVDLVKARAEGRPLRVKVKS